MRTYYQAPFGGGLQEPQSKPLSQRILDRMRELADTFGGADAHSAWRVAKDLDANGASVSSLMFKMAKRGQLVRGETKTSHGGHVYSLPA